MVIIATLLLIISKIPDFHSTWIRITHASQERNRMVRSIMLKYGPRPGLVLAAVMYSMIVLVSHCVCLYFNWFWLDIQYFISALIGSVFNIAVAHYNYTMKPNFFIRFISRHSGKFYR